MDNQSAITSPQVTLPTSPEKSALSWCAPLLTLIVAIGSVLGGYFWGEAINSFSDAGPLSLFIFSGMVLAVAFMCAMRKKPKEQSINANLVRDLAAYAQANKHCTFAAPPLLSVAAGNTQIFENVHILSPDPSRQYNDCALVVRLIPPPHSPLTGYPGYKGVPREHFINTDDVDSLVSILTNARGSPLGSFASIDAARKLGGKIVIISTEPSYSVIYLTEYLHVVTKQPREVCYCYIRSKIAINITSHLLANYLRAAGRLQHGQ